MLSSPNFGRCRGNREITVCAVKTNLRGGIRTDRNALDFFLFYVVEAKLENKCMCFQDYDNIVRKGTEKMYQASLSSPTSKMI